MRNFFSYLAFLGICLSLISCASVSNVNEWSALQGETYQEVPRAKLTNTAFADDYQDKLVTFKASFGQILAKPMVSNFDPKEFLGISLLSYGVMKGKAEDSAGFMFYNLLEKSKYDMVSSLKMGQGIKVSGRVHTLTNGTLSLYIHKIEVLP